MDTSKQTQTCVQEKEGTKPDYRLSLVRDTQHGDQWSNIGVGWSHNDGEGITFSCDILKLYGLKIIARKLK